MGIQIRKAVESDVEGILAIVNHAILHSTAIYDEEPRSLDTQLEWFRQKTLDNFPVYVAIIDEMLAGFGTYGPFRFKSGYRYTVEHSVYMHEHHTAKGAVAFCCNI